MRLRKKPWAKEYMGKFPELVTDQPYEKRGKWRTLFPGTDPDAPLHVEIGTGKGRFITEMAMAYPDRCFIGVEKHSSVLVTGVQRVEENPPPNLKLIEADVKHIEELFDEGEIDRLYINFTDPWPKKRHAKRRLTHPDFLNKYRTVLKSDGEIHFKTDNQGLFEYSLASMSQTGMAFQNVSLDLHNSGMEENIMTEYEEKFASLGMRIYRLESWYSEGEF
ncbi:tRNA (guanosine(46)-N7)-methyltransferase TrmB [Salisediminibacterium selenitireducens]|uniref:tRNA (guanine-N(7)-)-methyltransferase n=1 Tax=Bacillus selenitireducens (strain ATCC 700615 / DSM 15326 / MLS10) TaxID=439292 RepID=D6XSI2_BACIE|nr:tRNA (guanosine(46)-N7)-methyltransferase TrmB [Salisediminibacterium selenitireducens]ADH98768.1 tRNA (guanine-N(7)-)-methyltransferase [[Bacillus] selenitireducens MLS10]